MKLEDGVDAGKEDPQKEECDTEVIEEEFASSEDLEEKKQKLSEFNAHDNYAQEQIFIQDLGTGGVHIHYHGLKEESGEGEKKYDLREKKDCIEFIEKYFFTENFVLAIILLAFNSVYIEDITDLKKKVQKCFEERDNKEQTEQKKYVAIDTVLKMIGGQKVELDNKQICLNLEDESGTAFRNMLEQFPDLQQVILGLLFMVANDKKYYKTFYIDREISLLAKMIDCCGTMTINEIIPALHQNNNNICLLAGYVNWMIMENKREYAQQLIKQWLSDTRGWFWMPVSLVYVLQAETEQSCNDENSLEKILANKITYLTKRNGFFLAQLLIQSKKLQILICRIFYRLFQQADNYGKRKDIAKQYLRLIRMCYYQVDKVKYDLPLVVCERLEQHRQLKKILWIVMEEYSFRRQLYIILQAYLKEISEYSVSQETIKYISAYFCNMYQDESYREDVISFLKDNQNAVSNMILERLIEQKRRSNDE